MREPVSRTGEYVHQLWNGVLLESTLELRAALELLPDGSWADSTYALDMMQTLEALEGELVRRRLGDAYLQTLLSTPGASPADGEAAAPSLP